MIKKGILGIDDYARFGKFIEDIVNAGAYNLIISPKKKTIYFWVRASDIEKAKNVIKGRESEAKKVRGAYIVKVRW